MASAIIRRSALAPAFAAALALAVMAGLACQEVEEEDIPGRAAVLTPKTSPASSPAPSPSPGQLPSPAEGYEWYISPESNFGLPTYAVQIPAEWGPLNPGDSNPQDFAPPGLENILLGPSLTTVTTIAEAAYAPAFRFLLPSQGGQLCGILGSGQIPSASYTWEAFTFKCPVDASTACDVDHALNLIVCRSSDGKPAARTIDGRAAEIRVGAYFHSILVFESQSASVAASAFDQAVNTFTLR